MPILPVQTSVVNTEVINSDLPMLRIDRIRQSVPAELLAVVQWVVWRLERRDGKSTKVPYDAKTGRRAKSNEPDTWAPFEVAAAAYLTGNYSGLGFVFSEDDPYCGVDFDKCVGDGQIQPERHAQMLALGSYAEFSQSGAGVHVIGRGVLPEEGRKSTAHKMEFYDSGRFFVVTGDHIPGTPTTIRNFQRPLLELHRTLFPPTTTHRQPTTTPPTLDDQQMIDRAMHAKNGAAFARLWRGDASDHHGDDSAADQSLCLRLAWWTGGDPQRIDKLFRQSGLFRPKWDKKHRSDGRTYGQLTIDKAVGTVNSSYTGAGGSAPGSKEPEAPAERQPEPDPLGQRIQDLRHWLQRVDLANLVPANLQSARGYRTLAREKRLASAYLDLFEDYGKLNGPISQSQLMLRSGLGSSAVRAGQKMLVAIGFVRLLPTPDGNEGAYWWELGDSCVDSAVGDSPPPCVSTRAIYATIFTKEKFRDAWQRSPRRAYLRATMKSFGPNALLVADCLFDYGQQTPSLICERSHLSKYSVSRALAAFEEHSLIDVEKQGRHRLVSLKPEWLDEVRNLEPSMTTHGQLLKRECHDAERRAENYAGRLERGVGDVDRNVARLDKADETANAIIERQIYTLYPPDEAGDRMASILVAKKRRRNAALERIPHRLEAREELRRLGAPFAIAQYPELHGTLPQMIAHGLDLHRAAETEALWREVDVYRAGNSQSEQV